VQAGVARNGDREWPLDDFLLEESAFISDNNSFVVGVNAQRPVAEIRNKRLLASDKLSRRLEGSARTPTIKLDKPFLHVLAKGSGARVSVIINNFTLSAPPFMAICARR
jgi:hypothetical protein